MPSPPPPFLDPHLTPTTSGPSPPPPPPRLPTSQTLISPPSSPRRPRRYPTTQLLSPIPPIRPVSEPPTHPRPARDEFEEHFLNRRPSDTDGHLINQHLHSVDFHQLSDDDEEDVVSDDLPPNHSPSPPPSPPSTSHHSAPNQTTTRSSSSTARSARRHIPAETGAENCAGCARLCHENRALRRELDELEFELASDVLHRPADAFESAHGVAVVPSIPAPGKKKRGWGNVLRNAASFSAERKGGECERLRSEVRALAVTTEYLWRKLAKTEHEVAAYRVGEVRRRMRTGSGEIRPDLNVGCELEDE